MIACIRGRSANGRPRGQRSTSRGGDLADQLAVAPDALAVERRQQQAALAQVLVLVEQQHRARPEHGLHDLVRLARVEDARRRR